MSKIQYGDYVKELCCNKCNYAGEFKTMGPRLPPLPISICPDCGSELSYAVGRWMYTKVESPWWAIFSEDVTTYHGFLKQSEEPEKSTDGGDLKSRPHNNF